MTTDSRYRRHSLLHPLSIGIPLNQTSASSTGQRCERDQGGVCDPSSWEFTVMGPRLLSDLLEDQCACN
ncbi:hypothetical protein E4T56_gene13547 [Termitomyces sp. T112]|nr:hypothetical protein E4T56_gene13547 [Termitomyces sp. T112]